MNQKNNQFCFRMFAICHRLLSADISRMKKNTFLFLLFLLFLFIINIKCVTANNFHYFSSLFTTDMVNEHELIEKFKESLGNASEFPVFWKRQLITMECSGDLIIARFNNGFSGLTHRKYVEMTSEQNEKLLSERKKNYERYFELQKKEAASPQNDVDTLLHYAFELIKADANTIRKILTKDQLQRVRELELVLPPIIDNELEFSINFDAYEALELSNDQRNKLSEVKKQHSQLQNEVALSETGIMLSVKLPPTKEELLKGNKNTYIMQRLVQKNETIKKVNLFKAEVKNSIFNILNPQQQNKLAELNFEVNRQIAIKRVEIIQERQNNKTKTTK